MAQPRMTTQMLTLLAVLLEEPTAAWYGFDLLERADLKSGTLYPLLARLEQAGWLDSHWESIDPRVEGRPRRRLYVLTPTGEATARQELEAHLSRVARVSHGGWLPTGQGARTA
jgi:PadR family transcriptional regulator PadR